MPDKCETKVNFLQKKGAKRKMLHVQIKIGESLKKMYLNTLVVGESTLDLEAPAAGRV